MILPLMTHSAFAFFAQRTRIPTSARITGFFVMCFYWLEFEFELLLIFTGFFFGNYCRLIIDWTQRHRSFSSLGPP